MTTAVESIANRIGDIEILGIPIGDAAVGGGTAVLVSEVTDAFLLPRMPTAPMFVVKAGEAYVMAHWGGKLIGGRAAGLAALFLAYSAVRVVVPIDDLISRGLNRIGIAAHSMPTADQADLFIKNDGAREALPDYNVAMFGG